MNWRETESTSDAVRRLTAIIDERNARRNTLPGGGGGPGEITNPTCPSLEKAADDESIGLGMLDRRPPVATVSLGEDVDSGCGIGGRATCSPETFSFEANGSTRPDPDLTIGSTDRAKVPTLRGFE